MQGPIKINKSLSSAPGEAEGGGDAPQLCFQFASGQCTRGDMCSFSHDPSLIQTTNGSQGLSAHRQRLIPDQHIQEKFLQKRAGVGSIDDAGKLRKKPRT